ncbi:DUF1800 domain-containing protein [Brevundimonas variabilis]|uniref:Uncharacterized protein (DUF1800 family) n=1 Tax=Brevundimonas variabilis TaxID=74312 RepID=A0A7W9FGT9_9CAUL|nr:DUF1800 domain-containing protein [Brevundimonas variabilis]MBB5746998.1 uncharacterized protein (DUF1800 family) [Brevundimonas variabilis]
MGQFLLKRARGICLTMLVLGVSACGNINDQAGANGQSTSGSPLIEASSTKQNAARFLTQATFGPTDASVQQVQALGYRGWIDQQMATPSPSHLAYVDNRIAQIKLSNPDAALDATQFYESFWLYAATSPAQLRERMKLALSEIFVISFADPVVEVRGAASYYDMLGNNAFGNYRTLLEQVSLHPMMGVYLTHMANQKEDPATGRSPDENYAREVMQLMSIGVEQLNPDGTVRRDANGAAIPSYTSTDITELAKVFTGFSWYHPTPSNNTFLGRNRDPESAVRSMIPYGQYHSTSAKTFLGKSIAAGSTDARAELNEALDTLFNHPNTGPFLARRLIQRLVTSNPSPAYVGRVAAVFNNNGQGVRGDLAAVVRAILLDREASTIGTDPGSGKVREPMIRLTNWMRAFGATSVSGNYLIGSTRSNVSLGQAPLTAPSVFNFYRPGYVPPNTRLGAANLTAPEFQIVDEVSVAGYANTMVGAIGNGIGTGTDVRSTYAQEVAIAHDANALADRMNAILLYGQMSGRLRQRIIESVNSVPIPGGTASAAQITTARLNRTRIAIYLTMISPEYLVQR